MFSLLHSHKTQVVSAFAEIGLTPQLAHALHVLPREGLTMHALADELACDASNATGIVDRLEKRGLTERRTDKNDRRVKRVCLTAAGRRVREKVSERFRRPPPSIAALSVADQNALREILERALAHAEATRGERSA
jgi:MarR family transcriptional regulator, organic hydroperoxide resistance regulator